MLSDDRIFEIAEAYGALDSEHRRAEFARAIEAEACKEHDALIRQLAERLERADKISGYPNNKKVIAAARKWLEGAR